MNSIQDTHFRCFSHNNKYSHDEVHPIISQAVSHNNIIELEIAFHVLSPLPGLKNSDTSAIENHLHFLANSINADFSGRAYNMDSAKTCYPLFQKSNLLKKYRNKYGKNPIKVSELKNFVKKAADNNQDNVHIYCRYLELAVDTGIRFVHTGVNDVIRPNDELGVQLRKLNINDPNFSIDASKLIKLTENGGSDAVPDVLNIWIVDLPHSLLGFSNFPWEYVGPPFDGVCVSCYASGTNFETHDGIDFRRYNLYHTFTHEIAHCCGGILHTFNQEITVDPLTHLNREKHKNDDFVEDTPDQNKASQGNPYEHNEWIQDDGHTNYYQFMNFMDYSNDICMFLFTPGQRDRMRKVLLTYRKHMCRTTNKFFESETRFTTMNNNDDVNNSKMMTEEMYKNQRDVSFAEKIPKSTHNHTRPNWFLNWIGFLFNKLK